MNKGPIQKILRVSFQRGFFDSSVDEMATTLASIIRRSTEGEQGSQWVAYFGSADSNLNFD